MLGTLNRYIELKLDLAAKQTAHDAAVAQLNSDFDESVQNARQELAMLESSVQLYAVNHRESLFPGENKSREFANARVGFRTTPPAVGKRVSKDTFEAIALRLEELKWGEPYVDTKVTLKKDALLRDRAQLTDEQLKEAGIRFEQDEVFYIEPTSEAVERSRRSVEEIANVA